jgi:hypothetical protein
MATITPANNGKSICNSIVYFRIIKNNYRKQRLQRVENGSNAQDPDRR